MVRGRQTTTSRKASAIKKDEPVVVVDEEEPRKDDAEEIKCDETGEGGEKQDDGAADDGTEATYNIDEKCDENDEVIKLDDGENADNTDEKCDETDEVIKLDDGDEDGEKQDDTSEPISNADEKCATENLEEEISTENCEGENDKKEDVEINEKEVHQESANDDEELKPEKDRLPESELAEIKKILAMKQRFANGTGHLLFSYGPPTPGAKYRRTITCHLCRVANIWNLELLKLHLGGKRHQHYLQQPFVDQSRFRSFFPLYWSAVDNKVKQFKIYPGENIETVTPEYKKRIIFKPEWTPKRVAEELVQRFKKDSIYEYNKTNPVIGLDYILKMKSKKIISCFCALCDESLESDKVYPHVTSIEHQATYIIKHFPKLYEKVICGLKNKKGVSAEVSARDIFLKLYRKLEVKHGYKKMVPVDAADFKSSQPRYISRVRQMHHYNEETYKFDDEEVDLLIKKVNHNISISQPDPPTLDTIPTNEPQSGKKEASNVNPAQVRKRMRQIVGRDLLIKKSRTGPKVVAPDIDEIKSTYKMYKKNPESHPDYKVQWRKFWHERAAQLRAEKIDPKTHNFEKEWMPHWNRHLRKLYLNQIFVWKTYKRMAAGLATDGNVAKAPQAATKKLGAYQTQEVKNLASMLTNQRSSAAKIGLDTFHGNSNVGRNQRVNRRGPRGDSPPPKEARYQMQEPAYRQRRRAPVSVVSALRLLTALEDQLGSLGPKSVQFLSKAVLCEKNKQTRDLLKDSDLYVFFATAREKLKGQIYADVVEKSKIEAVKGAISDLNEITAIMDRAAPVAPVIKIELSDDADCFVDEKRNMGQREVFKFEKTDDYNYAENNRDSNSGRNYGNVKNNDGSNEMFSSHVASNFGRNNNNAGGQRNFNNNGNQGNFINDNVQRNYNSGSHQHRFNESGSQHNVNDPPAPRNFNEYGNFPNQNNMSATGYRPNNGEMSNYGGANSNNAQYNGPPNYPENTPGGNFNHNTSVRSYGNNNMNYPSGSGQMYRGNNNNSAPTSNQNVYSSGSRGGNWIGGHVYPNTRPNNSGFGYNSGMNTQSNPYPMAANNSFSNYGNYGGNFPSYN